MCWAASTGSVSTAAMYLGTDCAGPCSGPCPRSCSAAAQSDPGGCAGSPRGDFVVVAVAAAVVAVLCRLLVEPISDSADWRFAA